MSKTVGLTFKPEKKKETAAEKKARQKAEAATNEKDMKDNDTEKG